MDATLIQTTAAFVSMPEAKIQRSAELISVSAAKFQQGAASISTILPFSFTYPQLCQSIHRARLITNSIRQTIISFVLANESTHLMPEWVRPLHASTFQMPE